jgi:hypothetical protein
VRRALLPKTNFAERSWPNPDPGRAIERASHKMGATIDLILQRKQVVPLA